MWCWTIAALAQQPEETAVLVGTVLEQGSGLPLAGAEIRLGAERVEHAGEDGRFRLVVPAGTVELTITAADHREGRFVEHLATDEVVDVKYRLERYSWTEEVVVYGEAREEVARTVISVEELRRVPGSLGDPIRALQSLPSVSRGPDLSGDIVARGAEAFNTAAHVDQIRIPFLFHFLAGKSVVDPGVLADIEFYPGAVPPRYGDVSQAVINARTRFDPAEPGLHGRVHADLLELGWSGAANLGGGWTLRVGGRRAWVGALVNGGVWTWRQIQGLDRPDYRPPSLRVPYRDQQVRLVKDLGPDRVSFTLLGARDGVEIVPEWVDEDGDGRADRPTPPPLPYDPNLIFDSRFVRAQVRWDHESAGHSASSWVTVGHDAQQNLVPGLGLVGQTGLQFATLEVGWFSLGHTSTHTVREDVAATVGGDLTVQPGTITDLLEVPPATTSAQRVWAGPFAELAWSPGDWRLVPGLRVSAHQLRGPLAVVPEPRLSARYALDDRWSLVGYVGRLSQGPILQQAGVGLAQGELTVATALQSTVGLEARWPSGWGIDLAAYETEMDDLVVRQTELVVEPPPMTGTSGSTGVAALQEVPVYRSVRGRSFGIEAQVRMMPRGPSFGWVAAAVGRSLRYPAEGEPYRANADVPFNLVAVWGTGLGKDWTLSGRAQISSGLVFTPLVGMFAPKGDTWTAFAGVPNAERYPLYRRVDVRMDKTWTGPRARWTLYVDVYNALNHANPLFATYDWDYQELDVQAFVPILPALGLEVAY